jgi:hypothetical protein
MTGLLSIRRRIGFKGCKSGATDLIEIKITKMYSYFPLLHEIKENKYRIFMN